MSGPGDYDGDKDQCGSGEVPARFRSQFETIVASQVDIGETVPSIPGDVCCFVLGLSEAVADPLK